MISRSTERRAGSFDDDDDEVVLAAWGEAARKEAPPGRRSNDSKERAFCRRLMREPGVFLLEEEVRNEGGSGA